MNKAWITVTITGASGATVANNWVAASYPAVDSTAAALYQNAASQTYAKTYNGAFCVSTSTAGATSCTRKHVVDNETIVGATGDTFDIGALVGADPTTLQYAVLPIFIQANTAAAAIWTLKIDMIQNVTFSQRKNVVDV